MYKNNSWLSSNFKGCSPQFLTGLYCRTVIANGNASIICKENCIFLSHKTDYVKKMDVFIHY